MLYWLDLVLALTKSAAAAAPLVKMYTSPAAALIQPLEVTVNSSEKHWCSGR